MPDPEGAIEPPGLHADVPGSIMKNGNKVEDRHLKAFKAWFDGEFKAVIGETILLPHRTR